MFFSLPRLRHRYSQSRKPRQMIQAHKFGIIAAMVTQNLAARIQPQQNGQRPRWPKRHFNQFQFANEAAGPSHGISCKQGRSIVRHQGFSHVRAIDCNGPIYSYRGMKSRYSGATIQVNLNGQIVAVNYWIAKR
jgi:hypothetical protein